MIKPAVIEIVGCHTRSDANQAFGLLGGSEQLRYALIRESVHANAAIRWAADSQPGARFRSVAALVAKGIEFALGIAPSADILNDHVVAMPGEPHRMRIHDRRGD